MRSSERKDEDEKKGRKIFDYHGHFEALLVRSIVTI